MTLADYMAECLLNPDHGYYATRDPFGQAGDFTTAPEISQMFGEILGLCLAQAWIDQNRPSPFILAEIGPGRGTLMADVLRVIAAVPGMRDAGAVHMIEASAAMRARQRDTLADVEVHWHDDIRTLPKAPTFLLANEFFDALPIRQFIRHAEGWSERHIGIINSKLTFGLGPPGFLGLLSHRLGDTIPGDVVEICPALPSIATEIATRIETCGGVALVIDYGGWKSLGDTFQALKSHQITDPLAQPGLADLTAHVDFAALAAAFRTAGVAVTPMIPQGVFLDRLGITRRAEALASGLSGAALNSHIAAHRRLTHPEEMGKLFKVIACHPLSAPPPAGLDPANANDP